MSCTEYLARYVHSNLVATYSGFSDEVSVFRLNCSIWSKQEAPPRYWQGMEGRRGEGNDKKARNMEVENLMANIVSKSFQFSTL